MVIADKRRRLTDNKKWSMQDTCLKNPFKKGSETIWMFGCIQTRPNRETARTQSTSRCNGSDKYFCPFYFVVKGPAADATNAPQP